MMNDNRSELNEKKEAQMEIASQRGRFSVTPYKTRERFPVPLNTQAPGMAWVFFGESPGTVLSDSLKSLGTVLTDSFIDGTGTVRNC